jgi:hypothetical protein
MINLKCENCGLVNFSGEETCKRCGSALANMREFMNDSSTTSNQSGVGIGHQASAHPHGVSTMTKSQGKILIALVCIGIAVSAWSAYKPQPKYEYKVMRLMAESNDRTGSGALRYSSIQVPDKDLASIGAEGWELVGTFLEMETAFPNFGKEEYVTGLQPNVRPQSAILLFKRQTR